jgi:hypothetical protein
VSETIHKNDMWTLLLSTIRYSMGRTTYMTSLAPELVLRYKDYLTPRQLSQIADEIEKEIKIYERSGRTLGDPSDHSSWKKAAHDIQFIADELKHTGEVVDG